MNILFACGGTAGHINPAIALARLFQQRSPGTRVLFVGAEVGMETVLVPQEGFELKTVNITTFHRSWKRKDIIHNLGTIWNLGVSRRQADAILDDFNPRLVVGTGGYASYPVVRQAARRGIPTAIHESNAVPGLTTRALSKWVDCVMVGFEKSQGYYHHPERVVVTGTPVRGDFFRYTRKEARRRLGIDTGCPLLLSYWGSLGASRMNEKMVDFIGREYNEGAPFHHIHGAGGDYDAMRDALRRGGVNLEGHPRIDVREYIYDMPVVMAAADLVLCRAGASTLSELIAIARPSILVPSPHVTNNHQEKNAKVMGDAGASVLMRENECSGDTLYETAASLLADGERRAAMARALSGMSPPDAAGQIYETLLKLAK